MTQTQNNLQKVQQITKTLTKIKVKKWNIKNTIQNIYKNI